MSGAAGGASAGEPGREAPGTDSPRVFFPPPLVYLAALGIAYWVDRRALPMPLSLGERSGWRAPAGGLLVGLGLVLDLLALERFRRSATSALPFRPASAFVALGPYRWTRNPMYLGMTLLFAGFGLLLDSAWVVLAALVAALAIDRWVIPREERYLARRFGASYLDYASRVRRWL